MLGDADRPPFLLNGNGTWNNVYVLPCKTTVVSGGGDLCRGQGGGEPVPLGCLAPGAAPLPFPRAVLSNAPSSSSSSPRDTSLAAPPGGLPEAPLIIIYFYSVNVERRVFRCTISVCLDAPR